MLELLRSEPFYLRFVTVLVHMGTFLVLFLLLKRFLFDPILNRIDEREENWAETEARLDRRQDDLTEDLQAFEKRMAEERDRANERMQNLVSEGMDRRTEIVSEAHEKALEQLEQAREDIRKEKESALDELEQKTAEIASLMADRVAGVSVDPSALTSYEETTP